MAYTTTSNIPLALPTPGTREPAAISLINNNFISLNNHDHTNGLGLAVGRLRSGLQAARPAPSAAGHVYFATDTGLFYTDTGTAWITFLTSGGTATVTGWTLVDPVVRDSLQFGPEGSAAIDAALTRVAANKLRSDNLWGLGVVASDWNTARRVLQLGTAGAITGNDGGLGVQISDNNYLDAAVADRALMTGAATKLNMGYVAGNLIFANAPSVAAGATQTFTERLRVDAAGNLGLGAIPHPSWNLSGSLGQYPMIQVGARGIINGVAAGSGFTIRENLIYDGGSERAIGTGGSTYLNMASGALQIFTAPSVAAGAVTTSTARFSLSNTGTVSIAPAANTQAFLPYSAMTTATPPAVGINRTSPSTQYQWIGFVGGIASGDYYIGRRANSDALVFASWNGVSLVDRYIQQFNGTAWISVDAGLTTPALTLNAIGATYNHGIVTCTGTSTQMQWYMGGYGPYLNQYHTHIGPVYDTAINLGDGTHRFYALYAFVGTIQTSTREAKQDFQAVDDHEALKAVQSTPITRFRYRRPERQRPAPPRPPGQANRPPSAAEQAATQAAIDAEPDIVSQEQIGFVAEDAHPMLTMEDGVSVNPQHTASVALAAIRALAARVEALEAAGTPDRSRPDARPA